MHDKLIVETYATRAAWLAARRDPLTIGASEAAVALGVSPYAEPWSLWEAKRSLASGAALPADERDQKPLQRGNRWEPVVLAEYADASESVVVEPGTHFGRPGHLVTLSHRDFSWLRQSPDAFAVDRRGEFGHVEAKTAMDRDAWTRDRGAVIERWEDGAEKLLPAHYAVQAYVQLAISGMPWNDVCALVPAGGWLEVRWVRLMADADTQSSLVEALAEWREKHLVRGEVPTLDGSAACNRYLARRFAPSTEEREVRVATPEEAEKIKELARLRAQAKTLESRTKELVNDLVATTVGAKVTLSDAKGSPFGQSQTTSGRTTIDAEKLRAEFPEAYERCKRTGAATVTFATYKFAKE